MLPGSLTYKHPVYSSCGWCKRARTASAIWMDWMTAVGRRQMECWQCLKPSLTPLIGDRDKQEEVGYKAFLRPHLVFQADPPPPACPALLSMV